MPKKETCWVCSECGESFSEQKNAIACEKKCIKKKIKSELLEKRWFITSSPSDTRYIKHCVYCGKKLVECDSCYDGHRNEIGDVIFIEEGIEKVLNGRWCSDCVLILFDKLYLMISEKRNAKKNKKKNKKH